MSRNLLFSATKFKPLPNEEERTNPGRYGKALAEWVRDCLRSRGRQLPDEVIPEDWGWVVMIHRSPFPLWIGCSNMGSSKTQWGLFVAAEPNVFQRILRRIDPGPKVLALENELEAIVRADADLMDVDWEQMDDYD